MIQLDAVQTVAFAGLTLFAGYALCRAIPFFRRYNLPEPVVGGLLVALAVWWAHGQQTTLFTLDTTLKTPLMVAFFTTLGINASLRLLRVSGKQVMLFLLIGSIFAVLQNLIGISVAKLFGLNPMFGVLAGSATLTGGPATGLAFAGHFEQAGLVGAESLAVTAAMAGIICGGLVGGPVITVLMQRFKVQHPSQKATGAQLGEDEAVVVRYPSESAREFDALQIQRPELAHLLAVLIAVERNQLGVSLSGLTQQRFVISALEDGGQGILCNGFILELLHQGCHAGCTRLLPGGVV